MCFWGCETVKNKKVIPILIVVVLVVIGIYLQFGREIDVYNSFGSRAGNYYEEDITVIANQLYIVDTEKCKAEIIKKCTDNSFRTIRFNFENGLPDKWTVRVYPNRIAWKLGKESFCFTI